jgi:hypothetical protein
MMPAETPIQEGLCDTKWAGDPLYLMMAGLVAAKAGVRGALALSRVDLALSMGRNELDRLGRIGAARGVDKTHRFPCASVRHMAAVATLLQGLTLGEARELAARESVALRSHAALDATIAALTDALPASDANGGVAPPSCPTSLARARFSHGLGRTARLRPAASMQPGE